MFGIGLVEMLIVLLLAAALLLVLVRLASRR
jgi:competence protein ComGC